MALVGNRPEPADCWKYLRLSYQPQRYARYHTDMAENEPDVPGYTHTFMSAARLILEEIGGPLEANEIWHQIQSRGLVQSRGRTPERTLAVEMMRATAGSTHSQTRSTPLFYKSEGRFGLLEWLSTDEQASMRITPDQVQGDPQATSDDRDQPTHTRPPRSRWHGRLWSRLEQNATESSIEPVFQLVWPRRPELSLDVVIIDGRPLVRITERLRSLLQQIDADALLARLANDHQRQTWRTHSARLRDPRQKTISMNQAVRTLLMPIAAPERTTLNANVFQVMHVPRHSIEPLLDTQDRQLLASANLGDYFSLNQLGEALALREPAARNRRSPASTELSASPIARDSDTAPSANASLSDATGASSGSEIPDETAVSYPDETAEEEELEAESLWERHHNVIFFGPPGTGKSFMVKKIVKEFLDAQVFRVTFHPEYSYYDFVGTYRPVVGWLQVAAMFHDANGQEQSREPRVYYRFEPGPFNQALRAAAANPEQNIALVIEEINRGNCAAIFGDIFQLLDRVIDTPSHGTDGPKRVSGISEYAIIPTAEWASWLSQHLPATSEAWDGHALRLPSNLYIYATMNTSDQSLFPMDTAFRRRWAMSYRGVDAAEGPNTRVPLYDGDSQGVRWTDLIRTLNQAIVDHKGTDDKQMGPWFVRPHPGTPLVDPLEFASKVLFYLWNDVFRDSPNRVFVDGVSTYDQLLRRYESGRPVFRAEFLRF